MPGEKASINYNNLTLGGAIPSGERSAFDSKYSSYLEKISTFPAGSYEELLFSIHQLDKAGYAIDPGANNLLVDSNRKKFSLVDYKETDRALSRGMFPINEHNNLAYQMAMLLDMQYKVKIRGNYSASSQEQKLCRAILEKTLDAAAGLKYYRNASVKLPSSTTFHLRHINDKSCNSFTPQQIFEACGLTGSNWNAIRSALKDQEKGSYTSYSETIQIIRKNLQP